MINVSQAKLCCKIVMLEQANKHISLTKQSCDPGENETWSRTQCTLAFSASAVSVRMTKDQQYSSAHDQDGACPTDT